MDLKNFCIRLAGSREPWSATARYPSSLAGGIRELSNAGGIRWLVEYLHFIASQDGEGFQRGSARHVDAASFRGRHVKSAAYRYRGSTRHVVATSQGHDIARRCRLPGYNALSAAIRRQVFTFADSARCSYSVGEVFFPHRFTVFVTRTLDTSTSRHLIHLRPGPSGVTGFMGSLLDLMRQTWGC